MDTNSISSGIDFIFGKIHVGTSWTRDLITKIIGFIPGFDGRLGTILLMLILSIILGNFISKKFVTRPFSGSYFVWSSIISFMCFIILTYI